MEERELSDLYYKFIRDHRRQINEKLLDAYNHYYAKECDYSLKDGNFLGFVGVPLFVVWLIWGYNMETTKEQMFPAVVLIVLGFCIRYYGRCIATSACHNFFRMREYKEVLLWYVDQCRIAELSNATCNEELVNEKYDYFKNKIIYENFRYYEKK